MSTFTSEDIRTDVASSRGWQEHLGTHCEHWALICEQMTRVAAHDTSSR